MDGKKVKQTEADLALVLSLFPEQSSLSQVREFLKSKDLAHSASNWDEMIAKRLGHYLKSGELSQDDIFSLFAEVEEHGRQHVLLYRSIDPKDISPLFETSKLKSKLFSLAEFPNLGDPIYVKDLAKPTIVDIRYEKNAGGLCLIIKSVEKRYHSKNPEEEIRDGIRIIRYERTAYRATNVIRLWESGFMEVRIHSHESSIDYELQADALLKNISGLVNPQRFFKIPLVDMKTYLWDKKNRSNVKKKFVIRSSEHTNPFGSALRPSSKLLSESLLDDPEIVAAIDRFHAGRAYVDKASVKVREGDILDRQVGLLFSGAENEFAITSRLTKLEYEYILDLIVKISKIQR